MTEQERANVTAKLRLYYGIDNPDEQEIVAYYMYGASAMFLKDRSAQAANKLFGGSVKMDLHTILVKLQGTNKLLSLLCDELAAKATPQENDRLAALFSIEQSLAEVEKELGSQVNK